LAMSETTHGPTATDELRSPHSRLAKAENLLQEFVAWIIEDTGECKFSDFGECYTSGHPSDVDYNCLIVKTRLWLGGEA
jgi:hypothetical protein